jgi:hypothetical protein
MRWIWMIAPQIVSSPTKFYLSERQNKEEIRPDCHSPMSDGFNMQDASTQTTTCPDCPGKLAQRMGCPSPMGVLGCDHL